MNDAETILRAARDMRKQARTRGRAGENVPMNPEVVAEIARFMEVCGRDLRAAGRYGGTDEPGAVEEAHNIARIYLGEDQ
ncbi:hypothetical protein [Streptomyces pacificus]|uniref:Uncharacterized protein n=1 Tax=Streptomyces pacificus TaxID=2705029 RepID=A0A6A0AQ24_9ACTN|nr:hypothetical protein [Streptomyces pacificus]GFH34341.1 hypothetical protein SCWH03_05550 [Streptomyces pacificus]